MVQLILLAVGVFFTLFFYYAAWLNHQRDAQSRTHLAL